MYQHLKHALWPGHIVIILILNELQYTISPIQAVYILENDHVASLGLTVYVYTGNIKSNSPHSLPYLVATFNSQRSVTTDNYHSSLCSDKWILTIKTP